MVFHCSENNEIENIESAIAYNTQKQKDIRSSKRVAFRSFAFLLRWSIYLPLGDMSDIK